MSVEQNKENSSEKTLKERAIELIKKQYSAAADAKAHSYLSDGHTDVELAYTREAESMQEFAVELGILTKEEADLLHAYYWDNRDKIGTDIPDRFGD